VSEIQYLIGVDSDGTAFDSMGRKHLEAFIPAALEIWPMSDTVAIRFTELEKKVNLFSELRGINRFPGLLEVFERLAAEQPAEVARMIELEPLRAYIEGERVYSPNTLQAWMEKHPSSELEHVLAWSKRADVLFEQSCQGLEPFTGVRETLRDAAMAANVAVISSAAKAGLEKDWTAGGLMPYVTCLMSQEDGSKAEQLRKAAAACGGRVCALMLGDTQSDCDEAHAAGAMFYPIIPGAEEDSWKNFRKNTLPMFLSGMYSQEEEQTYIAALKKALGMR